LLNKIKSFFKPCLQHENILGYLLEIGLSQPIKIFINYPQEITANTVERNLTKMTFSRKEGCYLREVEEERLINSISKKYLFRIFCYLKPLKYYEIFLQLNTPDFDAGALKLLSTQVQIISQDKSKILHVLIPGAVDEWFVNDICTRRAINDGIKSLITPKLIASSLRPAYFISEYIDSKPVAQNAQDGESNYFDILVALTGFYQEMGGIQQVSFDVTYSNLVDLLYANLKNYDLDFAIKTKTKFIRFKEDLRNFCLPLQDISITYTDRIHGDVNLRENIIRRDDGSLIFIDWELSREGNLLYDLYYMLLHDSFKYNDILDCVIVQFLLNKQRQDELLKPFSEKLNLQLHYHELIAYLLLTIVDMLNTKVLILTKKRIPDLLNHEMIHARLNSFRKIMAFVDDLWDTCVVQP